MSSVSTSGSIFVSFYKCLKLMGVTPYLVTFHNVPKKVDGILPIKEIGIEKTGAFVVWNRVIILAWALHTLFQMYQLFYHIVNKSDSLQVLSLVAWSGTSLMGLIIASKFWKDGDRICELITKTNTLEAEIYGKIVPSENYIILYKFYFCSPYFIQKLTKANLKWLIIGLKSTQRNLNAYVYMPLSLIY